ncbi:MAG TPA: DNA polymerase III subunit beta [Candidatus Nanoarchaeia archaeon]|nr:DNA polymerase III subunit beta [Candidatus Nanoarchaeia archaeon]
MNLSILKENLKQGLFVVSHLAGKNANLPILNNILIEVKKEGVRLVTTNLEMGITHFIRGKVEKEGSFTVDAKIFTDYINLLPNKKIDLIKENGILNVQCENFKTKIKTEASEDFPLIPQIEKKNKKTVKAADFKKALAKVVFAAAASEARIELSGVLFTIAKNRLILAATDSYRLAEKELEIKEETKESAEATEQKVIVPARTVQEMLRILAGTETGEGGKKEIDFYISESQILFSVDNTELISRLIEGQYPDYKQILPAAGKTTAALNRFELIRAIRASALFSKSGINDINLDFPEGKNQAIVSSASGTTGENIVKIEAETSGIDNGIIINYQYLLDGLNNIDEETVKLEVVDGNTPCLIRPLGEKGYLYIIMPIKQ